MEINSPITRQKMDDKVLKNDFLFHMKCTEN